MYLDSDHSPTPPGGIHLELQSYTGHSQSVEGHVYPKLRVYPKSSLRPVLLKRRNQNLVESFRISIDYRQQFHSSPSEYYYLYPYLPRTWSCCISKGVKMILWVRFTCTGPQTPGEAWRDQRIRLTYWITRLDGRAGWRVWENNKGERRRQERIQEDRREEVGTEESEGGKGECERAALQLQEISIYRALLRCISFCLIPVSVCDREACAFVTLTGKGQSWLLFSFWTNIVQI